MYAAVICKLPVLSFHSGRVNNRNDQLIQCNGHILNPCTRTTHIYLYCIYLSTFENFPYRSFFPYSLSSAKTEILQK